MVIEGSLRCVFKSERKKVKKNREEERRKVLLLGFDYCQDLITVALFTVQPCVFKSENHF